MERLARSGRAGADDGRHRSRARSRTGRRAGSVDRRPVGRELADELPAPRERAYDGLSIAEIAEMRDQSPFDAIYDLLVEENLGISTVGLGTNAHTLPAFVAHPVRDDRERRDPVRRSPEPAHLRLLSDRAGRVRPGGASSPAAGGDPEDHRRSRRSASACPTAASCATALRPTSCASIRQRSKPRRRERTRSSTPRARIRDRQRPGRHRTRREHGGAPGRALRQGSGPNVSGQPSAMISAPEALAVDAGADVLRARRQCHRRRRHVRVRAGRGRSARLEHRRLRAAQPAAVRRGVSRQNSSSTPRPLAGR